MKIGIIRIDKMGDMILTLPIIKSIKAFDSSIEIDIFGSDKNTKILKNFQYIEQTINVDRTYVNKKNYDLVINFSPGWKSFFLCLFTKAKKRANIIYTSRYNNRLNSKILIRFFSKIFFNETLIINRTKNYINNKSIHQTDMMFELLKQCKIPYKKNIEIETFLPKEISIKSKKNICLIHLSSKWINKYYNEKDFIELLNNLKKKYNLLLTSDSTTRDKFDAIYEKYLIINDKNFREFKEVSEITLLDNLSFENWTQSIYSSNIVITPECGCTHIAALCKKNSKIIYDPDNKPNMINAEYSPWKSKYEKFIFNDKNLNKSLVANL